MKSFQSFITEAKHLLDYDHWGYLIPGGTIVDAKVDPEYTDPLINDHEHLWARMNGIYIDGRGKYGDAGKWYKWNSKTKKIGAEEKILSVQSYFYQQNWIRWLTKRHILQIEVPNVTITKEMTNNMINLLNYSPVTDVLTVKVIFEARSNRKFAEAVGFSGHDIPSFRRALMKYREQIS